MNLVLREPLLYARIGHRMVVELRREIAIQSFTPRRADAPQGVIAAEDIGQRRTDQVLETSLDAPNHGRRHVRARADQELARLRRLEFVLENADVVLGALLLELVQPGEV